MYRILVVEDEPWIRKGIIKCIEWDSLNLELAAEAENGLIALQYLESERIDIIITDMRMPVCDGSEMLSKIETRGYDCEIVIISEYSDYDYMRQAIHSKVFEYILKPIDANELNAILLRICKRLNVLQKEKMKHTNDPIKKYLSTLIYAKTSPGYSEIQKQASALAKNKSFLFTAVCIRKSVSLDADFLKHMKLIFVPDTMTNIKSYLFTYQVLENVVLILFMFDRAEADNAYRYLSDMVKKNLYCIQQEGRDTSLRCGVSEIADDIFQCGQALQQSIITLNFFHYGIGSTLFYRQVNTAPQFISIQIFDEQQLMAILINGKIDDGQHFVKLFIQTFYKLEYIYFPAVQKCTIDLLITTERCCSKSGFAVNISNFTEKNYIDIVYQLQWLDEVETLLYSIMEYVYREIASRRTLEEYDVVDQMIEYLSDNYADEFNLISIAQKYHMNYIYLSRLFKKRTGKNFTEYLLDIRMKKARQFLTEGGFKVKDVAQLVGYSNPYYFINSYKKYYGFTPTEDKKKKGE